jgi:hypothetical protein
MVGRKFLNILNLFYNFLFFYVLLLKIHFFKKNTLFKFIFNKKYILKSNYYYNIKHVLNIKCFLISQLIHKIFVTIFH